MDDYILSSVRIDEWMRRGVVRFQGGALFRVTILAEWIRYFNDLAVGETAAPACFLRENAAGTGMPPLRSH
jgi:hypothetical protein